MSDDCFIASIALYPSNRTITNWLACAGQRQTIAQYQALCSLLGTNYGGDGATFSFPDLRGRVPVSVGQASFQIFEGDTTSYSLGPPVGKTDGAASVKLTADQMPPHTHTTSTDPQAPNPIKFGAAGRATAATESAPGTKAFAVPPVLGGKQVTVYAAAPGSIALGTFGTVGGTGVSASTGSSTPFSVVQPSIALNYIMCISGEYPLRDI